MADSQTPSPLSRFGFFFLIGGVTLILALLGVLHYLSDATRKPPAAGSNTVPAPASAASPAKPAASPSATPADPAVAELSRTIGQALAVLRDPKNPNKAAALAALREALHQAPPKVAIDAIRQFLATGQDAPTGEGFTVGDGGALDAAPSLRTLLMDQLGVSSKDAGTADAAEIARATLDAKTSPDEWALAMRNLAWADPDGSKSLLAAKARELINYAPWQQAPTGGYMEAFDAAVYSGDATLIKDLAPLAAGNTPVQKAALVALERLSAVAPGKVADYLNANPGTLADLPLLRADYMGNVNLADPAQLAQAETYLNRADVSAAEKDKFIARLGVPAGFVADSLITAPDLNTMPLLERRALAGQTASNWLAAGKFPALQGALQQLVASTATAAGSP